MCFANERADSLDLDVMDKNMIAIKRLGSDPIETTNGLTSFHTIKNTN